MKPLRPPFELWLLLALLLNGCGYQLAGTSSSLPPHLTTLAIPVFTNSSSEPEIHRELTSAVVDSFIADGRLKIVRQGDASMVMKGNLFHYDLRAVAFGADDFASDYIVKLGVEIEVLDEVHDTYYVKNKFITEWDYRATAEIIDTEAARFVALEEAYKELGNRLVSLLIDQF